MQGLATHNLLHRLNAQARSADRDDIPLAPEVEAPRARATPNDPEARVIFRGTLIVLFFLGLFVLIMRDHEVRERQERAMVEAANVPLAEVCEHLELRGTPYAYSVCRTRDRYGKTVYRREGM